MKLVIAIIVLSLACLFLICLYNYRKGNKEKHNDILVTEFNSDDDDSFSANNMLKTASSDQKQKIKTSGSSKMSPTATKLTKTRALKVNSSEVSGMSPTSNNSKPFKFSAIQDGSHVTTDQFNMEEPILRNRHATNARSSYQNSGAYSSN